MTFYILLNKITTLFLSLNLLTTLTFDSEIQSYLYGGGSSEIYFELANNRKTLVLKALQQERNSNLLIITKKRKYYFNLLVDDKNPHQFIEVKDGVINHVLKKLWPLRIIRFLKGNLRLYL